MIGINSMFRLDGKTAIVTGGAQGLGEAIATAYAYAGADIVIVDINAEKAMGVRKKIADIGRACEVILTDLTSPDSIKEMVRKCEERFGHLDILVNNAGLGVKEAAENLSYDQWRKIIDLNVTGVFLCSQAVGKHMIERRNGKIVNIASIAGHVVCKGIDTSAYYASKGAVIMLTKSLAMEWVGYNIRVNSISPGWMNTPANSSLYADKEKYRTIVDCVPMKRIGDPWEITGAAIYLASEASSFVTGADVTVDGGYLCW